VILIKRGKGYVVLIFLVLAALAMNVVTNAFFDNEYYGSHLWPKVSTLLLASLLCLGTGLYFRTKPSAVKER